VDTRDSPEQAELRRSARQLARELGPGTVAGLDDVTRQARLAAAVRDAGWLELRDDADDGAPVAGGAEAAIVAEALAEAVADTAFTGPVLARDLLRRAGASARDVGVAYSSDLAGVAVVEGATTTTPLHLLDAANEASAVVLAPAGTGYRLGRIDAGETTSSSDLTRAIVSVPSQTSVEPLDAELTADALVSWTALGLALTSADLVGVMRGVLDVTVEYAADRKQYGVPVGSFQAVQHLLAEARCLLEGSASAALYAGWAVDNEPPERALEAGRTAKAYSSRAARTVCETAVQVHGGIGNTWDCIVHVYLRRALLSAQWFGDDAVQLTALQHERLGVPVGLP
jgi:alkylation response protein AidB-like acyl-CoA dehydrogenase